MQEGYFKDFDAWNEYAKKLNKNQFDGYFRSREIWWCALGTNIGSEQDGKNEYFERPVIILKKMKSDLALIAPVTSKISYHKDRVSAIIIGKNSQILLSQVKVVNEKRLLRRIGYLKIDVFQQTLMDLVSLILEKEPDGETPPMRRGISEPEGDVSQV
jgi:mRNA interferase MazF